MEKTNTHYLKFLKFFNIKFIISYYVQWQCEYCYMDKQKQR